MDEEKEPGQRAYEAFYDPATVSSRPVRKWRDLHNFEARAFANIEKVLLLSYGPAMSHIGNAKHGALVFAEAQGQDLRRAPAEFRLPDDQLAALMAAVLVAGLPPSNYEREKAFERARDLIARSKQPPPDPDWKANDGWNQGRNPG